MEKERYMQRIFLLVFSLVASLALAQQNNNFKEVKDFYDNHQQKIGQEFMRRSASLSNETDKMKLSMEYKYFLAKLDSVRNQAYIGALIKTKNAERLDKVDYSVFTKNAKSVDKKEDVAAEYSDGMEAFRKVVSENIYLVGIEDGPKTLKSKLSFVVERDGSIVDAVASGDNLIFNRQVEIAAYLTPKKFLPAKVQGQVVRARFNMPLTYNLE